MGHSLCPIARVIIGKLAVVSMVRVQLILVNILVGGALCFKPEPPITSAKGRFFVVLTLWSILMPDVILGARGWHPPIISSTLQLPLDRTVGVNCFSIIVLSLLLLTLSIIWRRWLLAMVHRLGGKDGTLMPEPVQWE